MRATSKMKNQVSIVIPAYNEEQGVSKQIMAIHEVMESSNWNYELILVDDGSTDSTIEEIKKHDVKIIRLPENRGYGAALKEGIFKAENDLIVITDADGTYPADAIPELLAKSNGYDMIVGARITNDAKLPWERRPAKWILRKLASYLAGYKIPDLNSGLRVMKKPVIERFFHILPSGFSFTTTITLCMLCNDYLVHYHPISYAERIGKSKIRPIDTYHFFLLILRTIILFNPLKIFLPFGTLFFLLGFAKLVFVDFPLRNVSETAVLGFLAAFIIWAIGLLSDQIARVGLARR